MFNSGSFRGNLYRLPERFALQEAEDSQFAGKILVADSEAPLPLGFEFDGVCERLAANACCQVELDGAFVFRDSEGRQIDGMIYDLAGKIQYIELLCEANRLRWQEVTETIAPASRDALCLQVLPNGWVTTVEQIDQSWP